MSHNEFTELFKYMNERFDENSKLHAATHADIGRVYKQLDKIIKKQEIDEDERLVMGHQLNRLDRWVHEVADKIGHQLTT